VLFDVLRAGRNVGLLGEHGRRILENGQCLERRPALPLGSERQSHQSFGHIEAPSPVGPLRQFGEDRVQGDRLGDHRLNVRSTGLFGGSLQDTNNFRRELSSTPMTVAASPFRGCVKEIGSPLTVVSNE
jgi:hypothetical protein